MIKDLYIPSHVSSEDNYPDVPAEQKLAAIAAAEPAIAPVMTDGLPVPVNENAFQAYFCDRFRQRVPYVKGIDFELSDRGNETHLDINWFDLGDKALRGHGLGTRLLRHTVEFSLGQADNLTTLTMRPVNLGVLNTMAKVVGRENIAFRHETNWYGQGQAKPLEAIFDDRRYGGREDRYLMHEVRASIDPEVVARLGQQAAAEQNKSERNNSE